MTNRLIKQEWVLEYIKLHQYVDILNKHFVDEYINKFNPKHEITPFGANRCKELGSLLSKLYNDGMLERTVVGLSGLEVGFPKWIYVYELKRQ